MKIKLNQASENLERQKENINKLNKKNTQISTSVQLRSTKNHKNNNNDQKQGRSIIRHYNFIAHQQGQNILMPKYMSQNLRNDSQVTIYQANILEHIIQQHKHYEFTLKKKLNYLAYRSSIILHLFRLMKKYKLKRKTIYLACYYLDRYNSVCNQKTKQKLSISIEASVLIAMKYEQIYPPPLKKWATFSQALIVQQQSKILKCLDFKLIYTSPQAFLQYYHHQHETPTSTQNLHQMLLDLYLITGQVYSLHPLSIVQSITASLRTTALVENSSIYQKQNEKTKQFIIQNYGLWEQIVKLNEQLR